MSSDDIGLVLGLLAGSWCLGFCGAYLVTVFKKGLDHI